RSQNLLRPDPRLCVSGTHKVVKHGNVIERTKQWRDLGRPEAALIGVQYRGNDRGTKRGAWIVRDTAAAPCLFARTGLQNDSTFGCGGIEIDATAGASPKGRACPR